MADFSPSFMLFCINSSPCNQCSPVPGFPWICSKSLFFNYGDLWQPWQFRQFFVTPPPTPGAAPTRPAPASLVPKPRPQARPHSPKLKNTKPMPKLDPTTDGSHWHEALALVGGPARVQEQN